MIGVTTMPDKEKAIERIHEAIDMGVCVDLFMDVLAMLKEQQEQIENLKQTAQSMMEGVCLLKEQEAVEPYVTGRGESFETAETWWYACGNCHEALDVNDKFCRHCGRAVKWNE